MVCEPIGDSIRSGRTEGGIVGLDPFSVFTRRNKARRFALTLFGSDRVMRVGLRKSVQRGSVWFAGVVRKELQEQRPGGKALTPPLKMATLERKRGGSTKILIEFGDLLRSIQAYRIGPTAYLVGVHRRVRRSGKRMTNIAAVHAKGTKDGSIPARPYLEPSFKKHKVKLSNMVGVAVSKDLFRALG